MSSWTGRSASTRWPARAALPLADLTRLNPELRSPITPQQPEGYELKVPDGITGDDARRARRRPDHAAAGLQDARRERATRFARIARRYGVSVASLASANSLTTRARVVARPGDHGAREGGQSVVQEEDEEAAATRSAGRGRPAAPAKSYKVKSGDTLYQIALRHGTTVAEILAVNGLGGSGLIKPGDRLKIPGK